MKPPLRFRADGKADFEGLFQIQLGLPVLLPDFQIQVRSGEEILGKERSRRGAELDDEIRLRADGDPLFEG